MWYFGTVLHAYFQNNTNAGNVDFSVDNIDYIRIKRRIMGTQIWVDMYDVPVFGINAFMFERIDRTVRGNAEYEYALCPVSGGIEGNLIINRVKTCFRGLFIAGKDNFFSTQLRPNINPQQQNKPIGTVSPLGRRYPMTVLNGDANYRTGTASAIFADYIETEKTYDIRNSWKLREALNMFLFDGDAKLLKHEDGRTYLISVSGGQISESGVGENTFLVDTSFEWAEIGNCDNGNDLYKYGFIDVRNGVHGMGGVSAFEDRLSRIEYMLQIIGETKADNLVYSDDSGLLQLSADGKPLGDPTDMEKRFGKEFIGHLLGP
jgi:hypothetical protein